ncbi:TetR/AcrR family transcriptional regulator [Mesotoga prima]|uniref:TetR/AcrR family transcriptional regulator n=1 Tax=Mesotoga prima TaxID=1184387 RepID=UPI002BB9B12F|nr:TetR/AcrR family transcriptional regulator [Mesotoga prima]HNQ70778.1 TetR/AcrR family transcriptional regulator [Mesotoga prima]HNS75879.1 TetR/AcrR family transcriptional regulator [Mesotoga prima]
MPKGTFFNLSETKRKRILEAAIDEFAENGYENSRVNEIVRRSSIPKGSFYQYFENKSDLFRYVLDIIYKKKMEIMTGIEISHRELSVFETLRVMVEAGIKMAEEDPRLLKISDSLVANKPLMDEVLIEYAPSSDDFIISLIRRGKNNGELADWVDPELSAKLITAFMLSLSEMIRSSSNGKITDETREKYLSLINLLEYGMKRREDYDSGM